MKKPILYLPRGTELRISKEEIQVIFSSSIAAYTWHGLKNHPLMQAKEFNYSAGRITFNGPTEKCPVDFRIRPLRHEIEQTKFFVAYKELLPKPNSPVLYKPCMVCLITESGLVHTRHPGGKYYFIGMDLFLEHFIPLKEAAEKLVGPQRSFIKDFITWTTAEQERYCQI